MGWTVFAAALGGLPTAFAAGTNTPAVRAAAAQAAALGTPIAQSVFVVPKSRADGVDPFFPLSTRLAQTDSSGASNRPPSAVELVVKGFSGSANSPLVIINDRTFAVGDAYEMTAGPARIRVRCLEIRLKDEMVVVEAGNERRELRIRSGK